MTIVMQDVACKLGEWVAENSGYVFGAESAPDGEWIELTVFRAKRVMEIGRYGVPISVVTPETALAFIRFGDDYITVGSCIVEGVDDVYPLAIAPVDRLFDELLCFIP